MAALLLWFENKPPEIVDCPPGSDPENLAEQYGSKIYEYWDTRWNPSGYVYRRCNHRKYIHHPAEYPMRDLQRRHKDLG